MDSASLLHSILSPPILFFFVGALAVLVRSDLEVPQPISKFFSLYLLLSIGFKGGVELSQSAPGATMWGTIGASIVMSALSPVIAFALLRRFLSLADAAATAASYGSVSAVTFIAATSLLDETGREHAAWMVAILAVMESPAIFTGAVLYRLGVRKRDRERGAGPHAHAGMGHLIREALTNGSVLLLVCSLVIGMVTGKEGWKALQPFTGDLFKGMLCLFLLDMGLQSARRLGELRRLGVAPLLFAAAMPVVNALLALLFARALGLGLGDAFLFTTLCASASYIAVPAAMRITIPDANPGIYVTLALGVTFPFNILVGFPLYLWLAQAVFGMD